MVTFGASTYHYVTAEPSFSHVYTFALLSALFYAAERFWDRPSVPGAVIAGVICGLMFSVRSYNIMYSVLFLYPPLLAGEADRYWRNHRLLGVWAGGIFLGALPELLVLKYYFGSYIANTYGDLHLVFDSPQLGNVLFSVRKGVFFWSPTLLIGLFGLGVALFSRIRWLAATCLSLIAVTVAVIACWPNWAFGGSFGHRGFVDCTPLFLIGLAALLDRVKPSLAWMGAVAILAILSIVNIGLMSSYWTGIIPGDGTTARSYRRGLEAPFAKVGLLRQRSGGDSRSARGLSAEVTLIGRPPGKYVVQSWGVAHFDALVKNTGTVTWLSDPGAGSVELAVRLVRAADRRSDKSGFPVMVPAVSEGRAVIPHDVEPNGQVQASVDLRVNAEPGEYVGTVEILSEAVAWFRDVGLSRPAEFQLEVPRTERAVAEEGCSLSFTGWDGQERAGQDWWRWSSGTGDVHIFVSQDRDITMDGAMSSIQSPNTIHVVLDGQSKTQLQTLTSAPSAFHGISLHLPKGGHTVEFISQNSGTRIPGDGRLLAIAVRNLQVQTPAGECKMQ
jgi:hypothetical protein